MSDPRPSLHRLGPDGLVIRFGETLTEAANARAQAAAVRLERAGLPGITEIAAGLVSCFVRLDPETEVTATRDRIAALLDDGAVPEGGPARLWTIPAVFGGPDGPHLAEVAERVGLSPGQAVEAIAGTEVRVLALGFAPGQPYAGLLPPAWDLPRQTSVTPRVPAGALVTAVRQLIVFANAAPTGWWRIGQTAFRCLRPAEDPTIPLRPGDRLRFAPVSAGQLSDLSQRPDGGATCEAAP